MLLNVVLKWTLLKECQGNILFTKYSNNLYKYKFSRIFTNLQILQESLQALLNQYVLIRVRLYLLILMIIVIIEKEREKEHTKKMQIFFVDVLENKVQIHRESQQESRETRRDWRATTESRSVGTKVYKTPIRYDEAKLLQSDSDLLQQRCRESLCTL